MMTCDDCTRSTVGTCWRHPKWYASPPVITGLPRITAVSEITGLPLAPAADGTLVSPDALCPDLLRHEQIGAADGPRGRLVRAFFWLLRVWPPAKHRLSS